MINKSDSRCAIARFCYHEYDYRPNWTPLSPITIIYFVLVCPASTVMAFNLEMIVSARAHVQLSNMYRTHLKVPNGGNNEKTALFKFKLLLVINRAEWIKGISYIWSRGRHFSSSLPGNRHLKLSSQKRSPGRNLGEHLSVRPSGTASRGTVLFVTCLRMRSFSRT